MGKRFRLCDTGSGGESGNPNCETSADIRLVMPNLQPAQGIVHGLFSVVVAADPHVKASLE